MSNFWEHDEVSLMSFIYMRMNVVFGARFMLDILIILYCNMLVGKCNSRFKFYFRNFFVFYFFLISTPYIRHNITLSIYSHKMLNIVNLII